MTLASAVEKPDVAAGAVNLGAPGLVSVLVAVLAGWLSLHVMSPNVDVSWLLVAGERILGGARLHSDIIETNPPFSIWLYMPLLAGESVTGVRAETLLAYGLPLLALASALLSGSILRKAGWFADDRSLWLLPVVTLLLSWAFPGDFGQREQIAVIALLPWLALLAARSRADGFAAGVWPQIVIAGFGAAVFVMIKPPMAALSMVLPAAWFAVSRRSWKPLFLPETMIAAAITFVYLGWIIVFHQPFLTGVMPLLATYYLPLRAPFVEVITHWPLLVFAAIAVAAWLQARPMNPDSATLVLLLAALGYLPGYVLMGKAWTYQAIPVLLFALLAFLIQFATTAAGKTISSMSRVIAIVVAGLALAIWYESLHSQSPPSAEHVAEIRRIAGPEPTVVTIAARLQSAHPLTRLIGGEYLSPVPAMWLAHNAELLAARAPDEAKRIAYLERRDAEIAASAALIVRLAPGLVIAGGSEPAAAETAIMSAPSIAAALEPYRLLYRTAGSAVFVRKDISPLR